MSNNYEQLKRELEEIFQMDQADLDFGIYRIMNSKREEINRYLDEQLKPQVKQILSSLVSENTDEIKNRMREIEEQAKQFKANPEDNTEYRELAKQKAGNLDIDGLEKEIFSDLYNFFSRYYEGGDFFPLRRYKTGVYSIPYEGEEVKLHWANQDQYYIKTSEYFTNYSFRLPKSEKRAHFRLIKVGTGQNSKKTKGKERRFILSEKEPLSFDNQDLVIGIDYIPDLEGRSQKKINQATIESLQANKQLGSFAELFTTENVNNNEITVLERHLKSYTARNSFDYFIHKDLGSFLRRELDFFLKNEVLVLNDIVDQMPKDFEKQLAKLKALKQIGHKIILFLAQLEDFQKKLWLKKKFVVETNWCITLDRIPEKFYTEIAAKDAQRKEWVRLFGIDEIKASNGDLPEICDSVPYSEPLSEAFLKDNPYLVLDTALFDEHFKQRLIAEIENLDEQTDGLLIHSENFQAINLLLGKYKEQVTCVHIDPPYNTQNSGFLYKNDYQHSSWLTMMENRISSGVLLLSKNGSFVCHIDENEHERLHLLFESISIPDAGTIVWDKRNPMTGGGGIAIQHEYITWRTKSDDVINLQNHNIESILEKAKYLIEKHGGVSEKTKKEFSSWVRKNEELSGGEKAYSKIDDKGQVYRGVSLRAPEPRTDPKFFEPLLHPTTKKPCSVPPNGFSRTPETLKAMIDRGEILFGPDEITQPQQKRFLTKDSKRQLSSVLPNAKKGKSDLDALGLENFPYCHSVSFYMQLLGSATNGIDDLVVDYFSGSGTTGHAVINLNREDGGRRRYILVEMGEHFDAVTKPRIQKAIYSRKWSNGKPKKLDSLLHELKKSLKGKKKKIKTLKGIDNQDEYDFQKQLISGEISNLESQIEEVQKLCDEGINNFGGSSHCFKTIHLESYEDTLNNLILGSNKSSGNRLLEDDGSQEQYLLSYMLDVESRDSLLDIDLFDKPFDYQLTINRLGERSKTTVDLVETFNYLIGFNISRQDQVRRFNVDFARDEEGKLIIKGAMRESDTGDFPYRILEGKACNGKQTLIIWREVTGNLEEDNAALDKYFRTQVDARMEREWHPDVIYVNSDNNLLNIRKDEEHWEVRLIEEAFHHLMFANEEM